jgi:uncharacterized low-complexity protein
MKKTSKTPLMAAMGAALISTAASTAANAEVNPFGVTELSSGYMQVAEMSCGANMKMPQGKGADGACAGAKKSDAKKMTDTKAAPADGKCGAGTCGAMMKDGKMKEGMENVCGAMMKGKEGECGANKKKTQ